MGEVKIHILHTNDIHSHFEKMPRIAWQVKRLSQKWRRAGEPVLYVDVGDHLDRMHPITEGTAGKANIEVLRLLKPDMVTLGNNEGLTFEKASLNRLYHEAPFPVLLSNVVDLETGQTPAWAQPVMHRKIQGVRVGFLGVTAAFNDFYELLGWHVTDPVETVERWVHRDAGTVDLWVILSHIGIHQDVDLTEVLPRGSVILGAHTHNTLPEGKWLGENLLAEAGKFGDYLGHVEVVVGGGQTDLHKRIRAELIPAEEGGEDLETALLIEEQHQIALRHLNQRAVYVPRPLEIRYDEESDLGNLLADGLRQLTGAPIGLVNSGQILGNIPAGSVRKGDLHALCPSPINPCRVKLKGSAILESLEQSLLKEFQERQIKGFGFRGKQLGNICTSGLRVTYDPTADSYQRIKEVWVGDAPLEPKKLYTVGTVDMFTFGVGYPELKKVSETRFYLPEFLRDLLEQNLKDEQMLSRTSRRCWRVL